MMPVLVHTPPAPVLSAAEARRQCRIDGDDASEDAYLEGLIAAATAHLDGPGGWLGRALGEQVLELCAPSFSWDAVGLPYPPVLEMAAVAYLDGAGDEQELDPARYRLDRLGESSWALRIVSGGVPSVARDRPDAVRIRYRAGWPMVDDVWTGPANVRHALLMLVARLHAQRGEDVSASLAEDRAIASLLGPSRLWSL